MERKVNEIFDFKGILLKAIEIKDSNTNCTNCYFNYLINCNIHCIPSERTDKKNLVFIKVEK